MPTKKSGDSRKQTSTRKQPQRDTKPKPKGEQPGRETTRSSEMSDEELEEKDESEAEE
jgi:hypothetical protein